MTTDTKVEYILMAGALGRAPIVLRRDTDATRIIPRAKTRAAWDTLSVQRITTTRTVETIAAWRKGVAADD